MELKKIYFDAFKSLLTKELEINHNCIGLVGINESGKSNLLHAINVLQGDRELTASDTPKMGNKKHKPSLRFEFELTPEECTTTLNKINNWADANTLIRRNIKGSNLIFTYQIIFHSEEEGDVHSFSLTGLELANDYTILSKVYCNDLYKIKHEDAFIPLKKAIIIKNSDIKINDEHLKIYEDLETINKDIKELEADIETTDQKAEDSDEDEDIEENAKDESNEGNSEEKKLPPEDGGHLSNENKQKQEKLEMLNSKKNELESCIKDFDFPKLINSIKEEIKEKTSIVSELENELKTIEGNISELEDLETPNDEQKKELDAKNDEKLQLKSKILGHEEDRNQKEKQLEILNKPLGEKYTNDITELNNHLEEILNETLFDLLPKVVFWEHNKDYILQSETLFADILSKDDLNDVSRPLVNIFRVGLEIQNINDLHKRINDIQADPNERSKVDRTLNSKINKFIKSVWPDYDQDLNITLENDRIRIEVYDPRYKEASYYNMEDRSQGAKTFISFLLTIGAEAERGVIKNTILLLDEPETHLHPSGVRFMLSELIKIANTGNIVIYATHSTFMIDRENYNRHIILEKEKEQTTIKPSSKDRIGYFMQEEVLHSTLDINLKKEIASTKSYNFVFEGSGDAILFEHFYTKISKNLPFSTDKTSYYHGGGCTNIQEYLVNRPIQLGTNWLFILDNDKPADDLRGFIEGRYKDYINKDIYVFQYENEENNSSKIELEDILPLPLILDVYKKTAIEHGHECKIQDLNELVTKDKTIKECDENIIKTFYSGKDIATFSKMFKGTFKEILNFEIKNKINETIDEKSFGIAFPNYFCWATKIIVAYPHFMYHL